jgi:hypothetical protein
MRRRLVNLGIFSPVICRGEALSNSEDIRIYRALKELGFRETPWQLIFDGQIGGLVFPYNRGSNEIHVRFYQDRIFAELEFSRSSIFHFVFPLYAANKYIADLLRDRIPPTCYSHLQRKLSTNLRDDEMSRPIWNGCPLANPYDALCKGEFSQGGVNPSPMGWLEDAYRDNWVCHSRRLAGHLEHFMLHWRLPPSVSFPFATYLL